VILGLSVTPFWMGRLHPILSVSPTFHRSLKNVSYSVDLDIEGGSNSYVDFVNQLRTHYDADTSKKYYVSAAPQCPYPDSYIGTSLNGAQFDMVYIQFCKSAPKLQLPFSKPVNHADNNACGVSHYGESAWNFGVSASQSN
jgi:chitinase